MTKLSSQPTPIQTIYNWYRTGALRVNRQYQRKLVWTLEEKQKLIDSILQQYPIPLVLLAERPGSDRSVNDILDGLQRLHTIVSFIEHGFALPDGRYFNVNEFPTAKEAKEEGKFHEYADVELLTRSDVSKILDYIIPISTIHSASEDVVTDVFSRINSYGHRLSDQERRQAGLVSEFSQFVRDIACEIRGDVSQETLALYDMPAISVDLPKSRYGYAVQADEVFWVRQGILRATDLRDSRDEEVIADITACLVGDKLVERSKTALDRIYDPQSPESTDYSARVQARGRGRLNEEIKYCIEVIDDAVAAGDSNSLRNLVFQSRTTNPFPTVFSVIFMAIHELSFGQGLVMANASGVHNAIRGIQARLNTGRDALSPDERRKNVNMVKGIINDYFVKGDVSKLAHGAPRDLDIENTLRRSKIETPRFEMKQGVLDVRGDRQFNEKLLKKICETTVAIANNGPQSGGGAVFIGVADDLDDAERIKAVDGVEYVEVDGRYVVGVDREASALDLTLEGYFQKIRDHISNTNLSSAVQTAVLSNMDMVSFRGHSVILLSIPDQAEVSYCDDKVFYRKGDQTVEAKPNEIVSVAGRF